MRITGGQARGRAVKLRQSRGVRPTSSRVREAVFSFVGHDLEGQSVLDAFGGSGIMAMEAWSRGARVVVVERHASTARSIGLAVREVGAEVTVTRADVLSWIGGQTAFDGIFADPPYALDPVPILSALAPYARQWLVMEVDEKTMLPPGCHGLEIDRDRVFGGTRIGVYRRGEGDVP